MLTARPLITLPLLVVLLGALGCNPLPDELVQSAGLTAQQLAAASGEIDAKEKGLRARVDGGAHGYLGPHAEREAWWDHFQKARQELAHTQGLYDAEVAPLLEKNSGDDAAALTSQVERVRGGLAKVNEEVAAPYARADLLVEARELGPERVGEAGQKLTVLERSLAAVSAKADRAALDYTEKRGDLAGRVAAVRTKVEATAAALRAAKQHLSDREGIGLAKLADALAAGRAAAGDAEAMSAELDGRIDELYASYAKTLVDMKSVYTVVVGRTSWNNYYDFPTEHEMLYPAQEVDGDTLDALDSFGDGPIYENGRPRIDAAVWAALSVDPRRGLPRGDDGYELWVSAIEEHYFHLYEYVDGVTRRKGDWEEVSSSLFEQHEDNLGMDVLVKPYGSYEDEALSEASPPGMAFVGNPRYGRWEDDGHGKRHWSWIETYVFYRLMFGGGHRYYYNDWNRWNGDYRGRRAWYGSGASARYGTYGSDTRRSSRYAGSTFARRGGFRSADASVRGSGPAGRGGGPGSRGK